MSQAAAPPHTPLGEASTRYTAVARALHWAIALMIIGQIAGGRWMVDLPFSDLKVQVYQLHKSFGYMVLFLSLFRLYWRFTHPVPALPPGMKAWEKMAAAATHWLFYGLMIGLPMTGWLLVSADPLTETFPTKIFFLIPVPNLPVPVDVDLSDQFVTVHAILARLTFVLLLLHVAAALKHHFINKDDVLSRMVPGVKAPVAVKKTSGGDTP